MGEKKRKEVSLLITLAWGPMGGKAPNILKGARVGSRIENLLQTPLLCAVARVRMSQSISKSYSLTDVM